MKSTTSASWAVAKVIMLGVPLILLTVNNSFAAPPNSNEDQIGFSSSSRQAYRNHENNAPLADYNIIPVVPESGIPLENPLGGPQQPMDLGIILNYLLARHSGMNNRARLFADVDSARNDLARKRSQNYNSRYCAFNAVSCFGRKK